MPLRIGCAGWSLPSGAKDQFTGSGTHLERYAEHFNAVEINSSFYRPHLPKTYARWAASTPDDFRFAVKIPKRITHECRLLGIDDDLRRFLDEVGSLQEKLGPLLVQLPPSLKWVGDVAEGFFGRLRECTAVPIVCEPRHATWFTREADQVLQTYRISRVAADPAPVPEAAHPGGSGAIMYLRLHGSPRIYYSSYSAEQIAAVAQRLQTLAAGATAWCIFDNTAAGAALDNALELLACLRERA